MKNIRAKNWNNEGKARITSLPASGRVPGKGRVRPQQPSHKGFANTVITFVPPVGMYLSTEPVALHETHSDVWSYYKGAKRAYAA